MKILQVCPQYYPSIGGVEEHVRNLSERLANEHEVTVFTCDPARKLDREQEINGVLVKRFRSFSPSNAYHLSFQMAKELNKATFDVVHGHSYHALPLYFSRNTRSKKFIVTPHYHGYGHTLFRNLIIKMYKPFGNNIFEHADEIVANSNFEKGLLIQDFKLRESSINVINPGINLAEHTRFNSVQKESATILYVGRLEEYKGIQHIIRTLPLLSQDFLLKIVGEGPYKAHLVKLINRLRLSEQVKFYKNLSRQVLQEMYAKAGLFMLLSRHEAYALSVAEALASKTPCIIANTSALAEWIDNKNCFGIDYPIDTAKLAELITRVIGTQISGVKLSDWDKVVKQVTRLYI